MPRKHLYNSFFRFAWTCVHWCTSPHWLRCWITLSCTSSQYNYEFRCCACATVVSKQFQKGTFWKTEKKLYLWCVTAKKYILTDTQFCSSLICHIIKFLYKRVSYGLLFSAVWVLHQLYNKQLHRHHRVHGWMLLIRSFEATLLIITVMTMAIFWLISWWSPISCLFKFTS